MNNSDLIVFIVFVVILVIAIVIAYKVIRKMLKTKIEVITAFTGGLGSGKTMLSVNLALKLYKRNRRKLKKLIKRRKLRNKILFWKKPKNTIFEMPLLISNIPVLIYKPFKITNIVLKWFGAKPRQPIYSTKLTKEMLLLQTSFPQGSVILLDEIGAWANQFQFNQENVIKVFDETVRLYRHYNAIETTNIEPYMVVNDQCSENINLVIRRRLNMVHNLSNFLCVWRIGFYYERIIAISEEIKTIDTRTGMENDTQDNSNFRWNFLFAKKHYDSHCYSERAKRLPRLPMQQFESLKTNDLLTCPNDDEHLYIALTGNDDEIKKRKDRLNKKNKLTSKRW